MHVTLLNKLTISHRIMMTLLMVPVFACMVKAEQLPVRTYTTADGLPSDWVRRIVQDSHGFLWFCTSDGLSRFSGYQFTNYGVEHGLPSPNISDLIETRSGVYWVATNGGGVCRFNPVTEPLPATAGRASGSGLSPFTVYPLGDEPMSNLVEVVYEDRAGQIWAGTDAGLFRLDGTGSQAAFRRIPLGLPQPDPLVMVVSFAEDREGSLWIGTDRGLVRRLPDGRMILYAVEPLQSFDGVTRLMFDRDGRLWVGNRSAAGGLIVLIPEPASSVATGRVLLAQRPARPKTSGLPEQNVRLPIAPGEVCRLTVADGLASNYSIGSGGISQSSDGRIWIGTDGGLTEFSDGRFRSYTTALGPGDRTVWSPVEDRDGNLWLGRVTGAMKISWNGFTTFNESDGLGNNKIKAIVENRRGELCAVSSKNDFSLNRFDGRRFTAIKPRFPSEIQGFGWGSSQVAFQDHAGEWWVPTGSGLCRFPRVTAMEQLSHTRVRAVYSQGSGDLPGNDVFRLFEDSHGDIWISIASVARDAVVRWERATESFHACSSAEGLPPFSPPEAYCEDAHGSLWFGFYTGGVARYREGHFRVFGGPEGLPPGVVTSLYLDHAGRLWVGTGQGGVARVDDTQADSPSFVTYTVADGLSSNQVWCLTEDRLGRMYFGTARTLDRFDPQTGRIRHYTKADGLASNSVSTALRDRQGTLWFGTADGISRLVPTPDSPPVPPPILISGLRIAGASYSISALGATEVPGLVLSPTQNQLSIDFVGLGFAAGEALRYQYQLAGADRDWSPPTDQRTVNYASLSPGSYRFLVRAISADGQPSELPASVTFIVLRPVWLQWWFLTSGALLILMVFYAFYRYKLARVVELERVRTRIATDLHDDIGSSLSHIAIISEVVRKRVQAHNLAAVPESLSRIAATSRELVDSMSDVVWAIDPRRDHLSDLTSRMRQFAAEVFTARGVDFQFVESGGTDRLRLGADLRRQVFLVFKESINNVARHSNCKGAEIEFRVDHGWIALTIKDNGEGFDVSRDGDGHGLISMRDRAESLGGELRIISNAGCGTTVTLRAPAGGRRLRRVRLPPQ